MKKETKIISAHSEYLPIKKLLINPASHAFHSDDSIAKQWTELNYLSKPHFEKAIAEYILFEEIFKKEDINIIHLPTDEEVGMDAIYCRDAAIATDYGMIICNMGKSLRKDEAHLHKSFYLDNDISILGEICSPGTIEGGDVAWIDEKTLAVGHSYRTNVEGIRQLKELLNPYGIDIIIVELPHYKGETDVFHLMSIFSPINKDLAVIYSPLMPISFRNLLLEKGYKFIEVPEEEFETMGCNVLAIAPSKCIVVEGNPKTKEELLQFDCEVIVYKGEEISLKGGGGPTCLTRPIHRIRDIRL